MRVPINTRLSALCVSAAALTASANASAHYYGEITTPDIPSDANSGARILIQTDILHNTCNIFTHEFVNHEMWYLTDTSGNYWVEVGFKDGATDGIDCVTQEIFWADSRPGGGYNEHYYSNGWTLGDWYEMQIVNDGSCSWNVQLGGLNLGDSTANCAGSGRVLQAGLETTSQSSGSAKGFLTEWAELNSAGTWTQAWDGVSMVWNSPPYIKQVNQGSNLGTEEVLNESF
jgi:hypothetical protein